MDVEPQAGPPQRSRSPEELALPLVARLVLELEVRNSVFVGLDGRSGAGKSTMAATIVERLHPTVAVTVIEGDQFYAGGSAATWDRRTPSSKADRVIDWRRQRSVLEQLRDGAVAEWRPFDWNAPDWDAEEPPLSGNVARSLPAPVVLLEGAYSCRPELHDLLDLRVLLEVPPQVRRQQLLQREGEAYRADWEGRWSAAEEHYFTTVMPPDRFHVVLGPV
jgi:uridine kinase